MNVLNICPHCSKERVSDGDWSSCKACEPILVDYPAIDQIENDQARRVVMEAFQAVHKLRCDFLQGLTWVGAGPKVKDAPRIDSYGLLAMPSWMTLRPKAMIQIEEDLIIQAIKVELPSTNSYVRLCLAAKEYVSRFEVFLLNQRKQALNL